MLDTHMGRVHDMVTGLLNGSSSMMPLLFKSRGVGFAVKKNDPVRQGHSLGANDQQCKTLPDAQLGKRKLHFYVCLCRNLAVRNSHFLLGLRLRLMGGGVTSLWRLGRWHREALLPLRAGNVAENPGKSK